MPPWLRGFLPAPMGVNQVERMRACCGALLAVLLAGLSTRIALGPSSQLSMLIAPVGASAVLMFALPASPLAQPWPVIGGNLVSAAIGVMFAQWIDEPMLAATLAIATAIAAMFALRCLHPPSGAITLTAVLGGPPIHAMGYGFVLSPVALNSLLLVLIAIAFNNATCRRYPHRPLTEQSNIHRTVDAKPTERFGFTPQDLDEVLARYNQVLDISRDDLEALFLQTEMHAYRRRFGDIACADIMSHDVVTVEFGATLDEAWTLLRRHRIKAMPVVDRGRRIIGIVTLTDFMRQAGLDSHVGLATRLRSLLRRVPLVHSEKPEVVGQIMSAPAKTAPMDMPIAELVPLLSDQGLHHVPVVDGEGRLAGMLTQSDLIAALYRGRLADPHTPARLPGRAAGTAAPAVPLIPKHQADVIPITRAAARQYGLRHSER